MPEATGEVSSTITEINPTVDNVTERRTRLVNAAKRIVSQGRETMQEAGGGTLEVLGERRQVLAGDVQKYSEDLSGLRVQMRVREVDQGARFAPKLQEERDRAEYGLRKTTEELALVTENESSVQAGGELLKRWELALEDGSWRDYFKRDEIKAEITSLETGEAGSEKDEEIAKLKERLEKANLLDPSLSTKSQERAKAEEEVKAAEREIESLRGRAKAIGEMWQEDDSVNNAELLRQQKRLTEAKQVLESLPEGTDRKEGEPEKIARETAGRLVSTLQKYLAFEERNQGNDLAEEEAQWNAFLESVGVPPENTESGESDDKRSAKQVEIEKTKGRGPESNFSAEGTAALKDLDKMQDQIKLEADKNRLQELESRLKDLDSQELRELADLRDKFGKEGAETTPEGDDNPEQDPGTPEPTENVEEKKKSWFQRAKEGAVNYLKSLTWKDRGRIYWLGLGVGAAGQVLLPPGLGPVLARTLGVQALNAITHFAYTNRVKEARQKLNEVGAESPEFEALKAKLESLEGKHATAKKRIADFAAGLAAGSIVGGIAEALGVDRAVGSAIHAGWEKVTGTSAQRAAETALRQSTFVGVDEGIRKGAEAVGNYGNLQEFFGGQINIPEGSNLWKESVGPIRQLLQKADGTVWVNDANGVDQANAVMGTLTRLARQRGIDFTRIAPGVFKWTDIFTSDEIQTAMKVAATETVDQYRPIYAATLAVAQ